MQRQYGTCYGLGSTFGHKNQQVPTVLGVKPVAFPFPRPGLVSVGISHWPPTWGRSTFCDILDWVLAACLKDYFKANTEQRRSYSGSGSHWPPGI